MHIKISNLHILEEVLKWCSQSQYSS